MQELMVGLMVAWSLWRVLRRYAPQLMYRVQNALANLVRKIGWLRLAVWLTPIVPVAAGCGSGCDGCGTSAAPSPNSSLKSSLKSSPSPNCASHAATPASIELESGEARPVQWR